jgi:hypothetical protein
MEKGTLPFKACDKDVSHFCLILLFSTTADFRGSGKMSFCCRTRKRMGSQMCWIELIQEERRGEREERGPSWAPGEGFHIDKVTEEMFVSRRDKG